MTALTSPPARSSIITKYWWGSTAVLVSEDAVSATPATPTEQPAREFAGWLQETADIAGKRHTAKSAVAFVCDDRGASASTRRFAKRYVNRSKRRIVREALNT